jgi:hypothetical protein
MKISEVFREDIGLSGVVGRGLALVQEAYVFLFLCFLSIVYLRAFIF